MTSSPGPKFVIIGDDLSGSAESAAVFSRYGYDVRIGLRSVPDSGSVRVVDADTRQLTPERARDRVAGVIAEVGTGRVVLKLDSLLRGHLVPHLAALQPESHPVVFAPTLPVQDRIVTGGIAYDQGRVIGGRPLQQLIVPLPAESIPASLDVADLTDRLTVTTGGGRIAVCDAVDDADLDRLVAAASELPGVRFAGAAGLIAALARRRPPGPKAARRHGQDRTGSRSGRSGGFAPVAPVLCVLGTAAHTARRQVEVLIATDPRTRVWTYPSDGGSSGIAAELRDQLAAGRSAVIRLPPPVADRDSRGVAPIGPGDHDPASTGNGVTTVDGPGTLESESVPLTEDVGLASELAELVAQVAADPAVPLVLSGGQTARAVLDRLGVITLEVTAEIHHGAVALRTDSGRILVTRPGSFGAPDSLVRIVAHLTHAAPVPGRPVPS